MKMFNCLSKTGIMALVVLTAFSTVSVTQGMNSNEKVFCGLTGFSAGSFVGKKIFNNVSKNYPKGSLSQQRYLKYARYSRNIGCFAAIPGISLVSFLATAMAYSQCSPGSILTEPLFIIAKVSILPFTVMVNGPVMAYEKLMVKDNTEKISQ